MQYLLTIHYLPCRYISFVSDTTRFSIIFVLEYLLHYIYSVFSKEYNKKEKEKNKTLLNFRKHIFAISSQANNKY